MLFKYYSILNDLFYSLLQDVQISKKRKSFLKIPVIAKKKKILKMLTVTVVE